MGTTEQNKKNDVVSFPFWRFVNTDQLYEPPCSPESDDKEKTNKCWPSFRISCAEHIFIFWFAWTVVLLDQKTTPSEIGQSRIQMWSIHTCSYDIFPSRWVTATFKPFFIYSIFGSLPILPQGRHLLRRHGNTRGTSSTNTNSPLGTPSLWPTMQIDIRSQCRDSPSPPVAAFECKID